MKSRHDIDPFHFKVMVDITAQNGEISAKSILDFCSVDSSSYGMHLDSSPSLNRASTDKLPRLTLDM